MPRDLSNYEDNRETGMLQNDPTPYSEMTTRAPREEQGNNKETRRRKEQEGKCRDNVSLQKGGRPHGGGAAASASGSMTQNAARLLASEFPNNNDPQSAASEENAHLELLEMEAIGDGQAEHEQDGETGDEDAMDIAGDISEFSGNPPKTRH